MNLDHIPHPLVEDHYHIRELIDSQEKRSADRQYHKDRIKNLEERETTLLDSKEFALTDFYCERCGKDFKAQAVRQIEVDWNNPSQSIAFYKTKCYQEHWCIRLITDKHKDGFFSKSRLVAMDRGNHFNDTLQPYETGFNMLYGKRNV